MKRIVKLSQRTEISPYKNLIHSLMILYELLLLLLSYKAINLRKYVLKYGFRMNPLVVVLVIQAK